MARLWDRGYEKEYQKVDINSEIYAVLQEADKLHKKTANISAECVDSGIKILFFRLSILASRTQQRVESRKGREDSVFKFEEDILEMEKNIAIEIERIRVFRKKISTSAKNLSIVEGIS